MCVSASDDGIGGYPHVSTVPLEVYIPLCVEELTRVEVVVERHMERMTQGRKVWELRVDHDVNIEQKVPIIVTAELMDLKLLVQDIPVWILSLGDDIEVRTNPIRIALDHRTCHRPDFW